MTKNLADLRREYIKSNLSKEALENDPIKQFSIWFDEAQTAEVNEPNAMTLSTVSPEGKPSSRIVLLKGLQENLLIFYTNYNSKKGDDIAKNPYVALNFFWPELERQVRVEGSATKTDEIESDIYFHSRPKGSKIGAWASPQSEIIENREVLETRLQYYEQQFKDQKVPRPSHWGGYKVEPESFEFWQGRLSRLHDRYKYLKSNGKWKIQRLAP